jgi:hypothetical protein
VPWPGTAVGSDAAAGWIAERDNPTLNANALNSKVDFFIDAGSRNLMGKKKIPKQTDVIEFSIG